MRDLINMLQQFSKRTIWSLIFVVSLALFAGQSIGLIPKTFEIQIVKIIDKYSDLLTAFATVAIAWFTWTLWKSSLAQGEQIDRTIQIYERQSQIMERQTKILDGQLTTQGPIVGYHIHDLDIKRNPEDKTALESYNISLIWKNFGKDVATDVTYTQRHLVVPGLVTDGSLEERSKLSDALPSAGDKPGHLYMPPEGDVYTSRIVLKADELVSLYKKETSLFVFCALRYGSRLRESTWFTEASVCLEFVLNQNPLTFGFGDVPVGGKVFLVAVRAYRHRTAPEIGTEY